MAKKKPQLKRRSARSIGSKKGKRKKSAKPKLTLKQRLARAKKLEALDAGKPVFKVSRERALKSQPQTRGTPSAVISDSVGRWEKNARNLPADVETVQRLLETAAQKLLAPQLDPKGVDGQIAQPPRKSNTVAAIEAFQSRFNISIDGLIEPDGQTWQALLQAGSPVADPSHPFRNDDFPQTYIQQISVRLDDPDHPLTLTWTGPKSDSQETGPFRTSPGAGLKGLNCDNEATSRRSGSKCTPKGTHPWKASNEDLTANLALHTLRGLCKAEALRFIISQVCPSTQLPTAVCALSCKMWLDLFRTTHLWMTHKW